jgi:hypothetical protein
MADKLNGSVIVANTIPGTTIQSGTITIAQLDPAIANVVNTPLHPKISSLSYPGDDLAANTGGGDSIVINGSGFGTNVQVYINNNIVPSVVRNNANAVTITTAAQAPGTYLVTLINTDDGGTAILVPGIQYSGTPTWVTTSPLDQQQALSAWSISLSATGDSPITYELQAGSSLPDGITLAANGLISGTMTSPPAEDTTYNFTVLAIDPELQDTPKAFSVSVTVVVDPQFQYTTLLLQADGTNNGNNHAFLDSSNNNFTITRNGNATQGSFTPFSPTGWSNYFDGTGDYLSLPDNAAFDIGLSGSPFTLECFFYPTTSSTDYQMLFGRGGGFAGWNGTNGWQITFFLYNNLLYLQYWSGSALVTFTVPLNAASIANQWNHLVASYNGTNVSLYANGTRLGTATATFGKPSASNITHIGKSVVSAETYYPTGYISNFRIVKGSAVYDPTQTNLTVPTTTLTSISNTSLLTCQSNRFRDASNNNFTVTRFGDVSVQTFSPFATNIAYSPAVHGGSAYFDGSGDSLTIPDNSVLKMETGNFTIEAWVYLSSTTRDQYIISKGTGGSNGYVLWSPSGGTLRFTYGASTNITTTTTISSNVWTHVAIVREGTGTNQFKLYINGVASATSTVTYNFNDTNIQRIGDGRTGSAVSPFLGFISNLRIVKGTAVYTANFTPPTSPLTAIANTSLLLNFTNAQIYDAAAGVVSETVGAAKVNTAIKQFGAGSIDLYTNNNTDYLFLKSANAADLGSGDFTVEFWMYPQTLTTSYSADSYACIMDADTAAGVSSTAWWVVHQQNQTIYWGTNNGTVAGITGNVITAANTWHHVAISRASGVIKTFVNGNQANTVSYSTAIGAQNRNLYIGKQPTNSRYFKGYIDDVRISKGLARYRYNFTPPTRAFATKGGTQTLTADEDFEYTTLLLSGNGTNNQNNHTFLDSSNNNFAITRFGNTTQGTFSPFSQTGWSNHFDGTGDALTLPSNSALALGDGDFTVEAWVYNQNGANLFPDIFSNSGSIIAFLPNDRSSIYRSILSDDNYPSSGNASLLVASGTIPQNYWTHLAWVRSGSTITVYINGAASGTATSSTNHTREMQVVGAIAQGSAPNLYYWNGYISNLRVVKGNAVYTANFTPSTTSLTAIANTSLLTCQSNRFVDNSSNAFAITRNGDVSVQAFSPFNPTAAWSAETNGGSAYFDGTGDYLSIPAGAAANLNSGDFTIELWFYPTASGTQRSLIQQGEASWRLNQSTGLKIEYAASGSLRITSSTDFVLNQWNHVALVQNGGTATLYLNGIASGTNASFRPSNSTANVAIGINTAGVGNVWPFLGYIANARVVKGTAVYTSSFTLPTAPLTAITNTSLLTNFTNAGIYDATSKNVLETVGDAKISTVQSKFGGSSMFFDGTGDYLVGASKALFQFNTGDFTVECWVYSQSSSGYQTFFSTRSSNTGENANSFFLGFNLNTRTPIVFGSSLILASSTGLSGSTWTHVAATRENGTLRIFVNGTQTGTTTYTTNLTGSTPAVGATSRPEHPFTGYIDDLRVTKGYARYVRNFIPPTTAFLTR